MAASTTGLTEPTPFAAVPAAPIPAAVTRAAPFLSGIDHLLAELEHLALMLHAEVLRIRAANLLNENQFRGLYIADEQIDAILYASPRANPHGNGAGSTPAEIQTVLDQIAAAENNLAARAATSEIVLPLHQLTSLYSLSAPERDALLIALAPDLDPRFEALYSYAQNDVTRKRASIGLILRLLAPTAADRLNLRSLFSPSGPLLQAPLVRISDESHDRETPFLSRSVIPEERILNFLLNHDEIDSCLRPFTTCTQPTRQLESLHLPLALKAELQQAADALPPDGAVLFFQGPRGTGKRTAAEALSAAAGRELLTADMRQAPTTALQQTLTLLCREATLRRANLLLTHAEATLKDEGGSALAFARSLPRLIADSATTVFISSDPPWPIAEATLPRVWSTFEFPIPEFPERTQLWQDALASSGTTTPPGTAAALANQFVLTGGQIHRACRMAAAHAQLRNQPASTLTHAQFEAVARAQSSQALKNRAQKVATVHHWPDLVLPPRTLQQLREICAAEKYRSLVYSDWGFDRRLMHGKGLNALFSGPSGTGKTMSAGIVARELALDLYKIDLSSVISKYIGETEKHLSQIFREARSSNAILFFDEADAIFGKRSEVKDAHDRYANVEVAYLLQKMEEYEGVVILATNFRKNIDDAFTRRIHYIVEFPLPEAQYRERIWRNLIPATAPLAEDVDFAFLARQFDLAGGSIRNITLAAALLAAEEGGEIRMEHFVLATSRELQKMGKLPSRSDFREYYDLTRERG
jgi:DNA polymerase III delta prime subunit